MSIILCTVCFLACGVDSAAQHLSASSRGILKQREDSLKTLAREIVAGREAADRFRADSAFTRMFVRALKYPNSFYFPFDSLETISRVYAPDSSFRIITWQVVRDEEIYRRHGTIQIRTQDGTLKLYPLIDRTLLIGNATDTVTNHEWWIGSIYYRIILKEFNGRKYYTLLGYDEYSMRSTRKRIEVMTFGAGGEPVFGGPYFSFQDQQSPRTLQARFWIEYKKQGNARMQYDEELDLILFDHLISETNEPAKKYTYIPDGDYEGFRWQEGQWVHIDKVFTKVHQDGKPPLKMPLFEDKFGNQVDPKPPAKKKGKGSDN